MSTSPLNADSRSEFEKWMNLNFDTRLVKSGIGYKGQVVNSLWMCWQASRGAVVIELPNKIDPDFDVVEAIIPTANPDEYACCVAADMWNKCIDKSALSIRAAGITVKGDSDEANANAS